MKKVETVKKLEALSDSLFVTITDEEAALIWGGAEIVRTYDGQGRYIGRDVIDGS